MRFGVNRFIHEPKGQEGAMPRITLCGYDASKVQGMVGRIEVVLKGVRIGDGSVIHVDRSSEVVSGDGKRTPKPYLQLFTTEIDWVYSILYHLHSNKVHEDLEVSGAVILFFDADDFVEDVWLEKWKKYCKEHNIGVA